MGIEITKYVIDACALITYLRNEPGGDRFRELLKQSQNKFFMHAVNLGEVYYEAVRVSGSETAQKLFETVTLLPITVIWNLDISLLELVGKYKTSYRVSYADYFVLALSEREKAIIISTDHHEFDVIDNTKQLLFYWLR